MKDKVWQTIEKYHLIEQNDHILVGLSGGADSVALLYFLLCAKEKLQIKLSACHVNHHIRGAESDRDEAHVTTLCKQWKIPLYVEHIAALQLAKEKKQSLELAAREARYQIFDKLARKLHAKIATAHTLSDSMETVFFHFCRGTGLRGLSGIPAKRGNIIRPFIACERKEIEMFCADHNLPYVTDSTNLDDKYHRNLIRHKVIPVMYQVNASAGESFQRTTEILRQEDAFLDRIAIQNYEQLFVEKKAKIKNLKSLDKVITYRLLKYLLKLHQIEPQYHFVERMFQLLQKESGALQIDKNWFAVCKGGLFFLQQKKQRKTVEPVCYDVFKPEVGKTYVFTFGEKKVSMILLNYKKYQNFVKNDVHLLKNAIDYDKINGHVNLRYKLAGDKITLQRRNCTKSLKKLLNEDKVPLEQRDTFVVATNGVQLIWAENYGTDQSFQINEHTKQFLIISLNGEFVYEE